MKDDEILRYIGAQKPDERLLADIERVREALLPRLRRRHVLARFDLERTDDGIRAAGTCLTLTGADIARFLGEERTCCLFAATLGLEADRAVAYLRTKSASDGLIADAVASAEIEEYCDEIQAGIGFPCRRYSCGYGDLPLSLQPDFLAALNAQKTIGLFCGEGGLMTPLKSVTAVVCAGNEGYEFHTCESCLRRDFCELKKVGKYCGR